MIHRTSNGFTLIETLVYIALFSLIIGGALVGAWQIISGAGADASRIAAESEGSFIMRKFAWALEGTPSGITTSAGHLTFDNYSEHFDILASDGEITLNGIGLSSDNVVVRDVVFEHDADSVIASFSVNNRPFGPATFYVN